MPTTRTFLAQTSALTQTKEKQREKKSVLPLKCSAKSDNGRRERREDVSTIVIKAVTIIGKRAEKGIKHHTICQYISIFFLLCLLFVAQPASARGSSATRRA
jgi:hypothetical protein